MDIDANAQVTPVDGKMLSSEFTAPWLRAMYHLGTLARSNEKVAGMICLQSAGTTAADAKRDRKGKEKVEFSDMPRGEPALVLSGSETGPTIFTALIGLLGDQQFVGSHRLVGVLLMVLNVSINALKTDLRSAAAERQFSLETAQTKMLISPAEARLLLSILDRDVDNGMLSRSLQRVLGTWLELYSLREPSAPAVTSTPATAAPGAMDVESSAAAPAPAAATTAAVPAPAPATAATAPAPATASAAGASRPGPIVFAPGELGFTLVQVFSEVLRDLIATRVQTALRELHDLYVDLSSEDRRNIPIAVPTRTGARVLRLVRCLRMMSEYIQPLQPLSMQDPDPRTDLRPLWVALDRVIRLIEDGKVAVTSTRSPAVVHILPYLEAYFVAYAPHRSQLASAAANSSMAHGQGQSQSQSQNHDGTAGAAASGAPATAAAAGPTLDKIFIPEFVRALEGWKHTINVVVKDKPVLIEFEGPFACIGYLQRVLDFDNKRTIFRHQIRKLTGGRHRGSLRLLVRRSHVFEDSYHQMRSRSTDEMRGKLHIEFADEPGMDAGGLSREWFSVLSKEIFNPNYALFVPSSAQNLTFQPNRVSYINPEHLSYFEFIGRIIGKALHDGFLLDAHFTRSFYKHILGQKVTFDDLQAVDSDFHKSLQWMLDNPIEGVMDLTFSAELDKFGVIENIELVPNGAAIPVTDANKHEYVNMIAEMRLSTAIEPQIKAFLQGFRELIPGHLIQAFSEHELELLISGLPEIDTNDLRANTEYSGYTETSPVIVWFWEVVNAMSKEDKAHLVQFVTGTSKVPLDGFKALMGMNGPQKFMINKIYGARNRLPSSHTCMNSLDLPDYESREELKEKLFQAIREGNEGFGFL